MHVKFYIARILEMAIAMKLAPTYIEWSDAFVLCQTWSVWNTSYWMMSLIYPLEKEEGGQGGEE